MLIIPSTKPISDDFPFPRKSPGFLLQQTHSSYWSLFPNEVTAQENRDATRTLFSMTVNVLRAPPCSGLLEPKRNVNSLLFPLLPLEIVVFLFSRNCRRNILKMGAKKFFKERSLKVSDKKVTKAAELTLRESIWPIALVTVLFFLWGFSYGLLDTLNKHFQKVLHIDRARSAGLQAAYFGYVYQYRRVLE